MSSDRVDNRLFPVPQGILNLDWLIPAKRRELYRVRFVVLSFPFFVFLTRAPQFLAENVRYDLPLIFRTRSAYHGLPEAEQRRMNLQPALLAFVGLGAAASPGMVL
jgi:hypothetical protein